MSLELKLDYRMRWMDFDRYGHLQPWALLDLFQDVATKHAIDLGIGHSDMLAQGVFWAIVRMRCEITREPEHYKTVTVRTWPHTLSRFSIIRDFQMLDEEGSPLARASSEWVLVDVNSRKFVSAREQYKGSTDFLEDRAFDKKARKVPPFEEGNRPIRTIVPAFSDIDINGHVNNAMYAKYVTDALELGEELAIRSFQIDYRQEALPGDPLHIHSLMEDGGARVKGLREDGNLSFACAVEFR